MTFLMKYTWATFLTLTVPPVRFLVVSLEGRAVHLVTLVQEAEQRVSELQARVGSEALGELEGSDPDRHLKAWEWRLRLFRRMQTGFEHASKSSGWLWWLFLTTLVFILATDFTVGIPSRLS